MTAPELQLHLLGEAGWRRAGGGFAPLSAKDAALLAKLALDGPQPRALVCELLWPGATPEAAAASLRQRASRLHRSTGIPLVELGRQVRLNPAVAVDALRLPELPAEALLASGTLLSGVDVGEHDELDRWLVQARAQVTEGCAQALADHAEALAREGRLREALPLAQRVAELLPLNEHAGRRVMRLHYLRNDRAAGQEAFWRLNGALRDELGIRPSAETLQLMQTIEAAESAQALPSRPVPVSVLRPPVLVGRKAAWQAMAAAWQGQQGFLLVGEAGLGKSRLLEEFAREREGVVAERAQPGDTHAPYALLGRLLARIAQQFRPALPDAVRAELARLRPEFGPTPPEPAQTPLLWQAVERLLEGALGAGLQAVLVDDLHNADAASLEALRWLGASRPLRTLAVGLATRPWADDELGRVLAAWLEDSHRPVRIDLQPLSPAELATLLSSLALPALLDNTLAAQLYRHAGGHPLYTLATLQDALAGGIDLAALQLPHPSSVQALLDTRLRKLPAAAQDLLRVAAVAGEDLSAERAARLLGCQVLTLTERWSVLEAANVLRGDAFSHDLVHESALRLMPRGVRQALHRQFAALLDAEGGAPDARRAWHWEQGERWGEAGRAWLAAAQAARRAGRLSEHITLCERAARCHAEAGDAPARFETLHARLDALQLCHGGAAVRAALPEMEALADSAWQRVRCRLARAEALLDGEHSQEAVEETRLAVHDTEAFPALRADAGALHAQALVQCGAVEPALEAATAALAAAERAADGEARLRVTNALCYVHYAAGRLADALDWQQRAVALAETLGHRAEAAAGAGNLAALLASIGDVPGTYAQALHSRDRHRDLGLGEDSTLGVVNHIVLGAAAAALGRFDEALPALEAAVASAGERAATAARAKARLALAGLWLTLGRADAAAPLLDALPADIGPGMRMQAELLFARIAEQQGQSAQHHWTRLGALAQRHDQLPLVQSAWFEVSFQGDPATMVTRLRAVREECHRLGLHGTARSLLWRELERALELPGAEAATAALALAQELRPHAARGTSAKCYPPRTWLSLAEAYRRTGEEADRRASLELAREWVETAVRHVPAPHREAFLHGNPTNRLLLGKAGVP